VFRVSDEEQQNIKKIDEEGNEYLKTITYGS
jgi:hypothetical protein